MYDLTDVDSLKSAQEWYDQVMNQVDITELTIALVGNKADDIDRVEVSKKDADKLAFDVGAKFHIQVSAKTNEKIESMFRQMGIELINADPNVSVFHDFRSPQVQPSYEITRRLCYVVRLDERTLSKT